MATLEFRPINITLFKLPHHPQTKNPQIRNPSCFSTAMSNPYSYSYNYNYNPNYNYNNYNNIVQTWQPNMPTVAEVARHPFITADTGLFSLLGTDRIPEVKDQRPANHCSRIGNAHMLSYYASEILQVNTTLSTQQLVDEGPGPLLGETGVHSERILDHLKVEKNALGLESNYDYINGFNPPHLRPVKKGLGVYVDSYELITSYKDACDIIKYQGPIVADIKVTPELVDFRHGVHGDGVYSLDHSTFPAGHRFLGDHTLLLVGFHELKHYFLVQNSWGIWFGFNGFAKIEFNNFNNVYRLKGVKIVSDLQGFV